MPAGSPIAMQIRGLKVRILVFRARASNRILHSNSHRNSLDDARSVANHTEPVIPGRREAASRNQENTDRKILDAVCVGSGFPRLVRAPGRQRTAQPTASHGGLCCVQPTLRIWRKFMTEGAVGFIGLGLMGQGFTRRLAEKGYRVVGFDIDQGRTRAASDWGVNPANARRKLREPATSFS